ncbi:MAG TPA: hypothetical protein PKC72_14650 [Chitinophagaceae bacterium]|nr:hypothetical protein [Chitinophagaceae bacterium]
MLNVKTTSITEARRDRMIGFLSKNNCHFVANYNIWAKSPLFYEIISCSNKAPYALERGVIVRRVEGVAIRIAYGSFTFIKGLK